MFLFTIVELKQQKVISLEEGQRVGFIVAVGKKGPQALKIVLLD
ncbi:cold-shock protein [Liquorilactobacillus satsumensis]|nr:cold-shock protein [Liquorilactobacillus satsumensis]